MSYLLTQYSHGAGCGCKIAPKVLDDILHTAVPVERDPRLLVGNEGRDDAAVFDLGDGTALLSTTDFFMPIVDDPFDFGRIASVNAISDIYAMGGTPLMAIAVLGWPVNVLPPEVANGVLEGSRAACREAGIPLAGGHSIDSPEPIYGLAVSGRVKLEHLKTNAGARPGAQLYLTKPLGVGILTTAQKKGELLPEHADIAPALMRQPNRIGEIFGRLPYVLAMTDVTGFGLLGHLGEMCSSGRVSAVLHRDAIPTLGHELLGYYLLRKCIPGGTHRNWESYGERIAGADDPAIRHVLADPQTSGGLLVAVDPEYCRPFEEVAEANGLVLKPIGFMIASQAALITVV